MHSRWTRSMATVAVGVCLMTAPAAFHPASAAERAKLFVPPDTVVERDYPGIPVTSPGPWVGGHQSQRPDECRDASHCDVIPLDFRFAPALADHYVRIELTFPVRAERDTPFGKFPATDLDMYLWEDAAEATPMVEAVSAGSPEIIQTSLWRDGEFLLVIANTVGTNDTYHLKITTSAQPFTQPIDASDRRPPPPAGETEDVDPPAGGGTTGPVLVPTHAAGSVDIGMSAPDVAAFLTDPDFARPFDGRSAVEALEEELAGLTRRRQRPKPVPQEPSDGALLLWLVVVPAAAVTGERLLFRRRPLISSAA